MACQAWLGCRPCIGVVTSWGLMVMAVRACFSLTPNAPWLFMHFLLSRGILRTLLHKARGPCDES